MSKQKLGIDPLAWIVSTKEERIPSKRVKQEKAVSKPSLQEKKVLPKKQEEDETQRQTYHLKKEIIDKVQSYAYWERLGISEVVNSALEEYFKNKKVKSIPKK